MPIFKRCSRCGKRIPSGSKCSCKSKRYKEEDKYKTNSKEKNFYSSDEWQRLRDKAREFFFGIDIYSYYNEGIIEYGQTVHHVIPIKIEWSKRNEFDNLIYLTESNHRQLHYRMEHGEYDIVLDEVYTVIERFKKDFKSF